MPAIILEGGTGRLKDMHCGGRGMESENHLLRCQETAAIVTKADGKDRRQKASSMQALTTARSESVLSESSPISHI